MKAAAGTLNDKIAALAVVVRHEAAGCKSPMKAAAAELGMNRGTLRRWMHELRKDGSDLGQAAETELVDAAVEGSLGYDPVLPGFAITGIDTQRDAKGRTKGDTVRTRRASIRKPFEVPAGMEIVKGTVHRRDGVVVQDWPRYAPATRDPQIVAQEFITALNTSLKPARIIPPSTKVLADWMTLYPIVDWHIGLFAAAEETGSHDWTTNIARQTIMAGLRDVMSITKESGRAVLLNSGDMMHFDGFAPMTARSGNVLDTDSRYPIIRRTAVAMFDEAIQMALQRHEFVDVVSLPGNHDDQSAGWIALALDMKYRDHPRVNVDVGIKRMWWRRYDKVFLGSTHGDRAKLGDMALVMAVDNPMDWALSTRRVVYTAHIHHEVTKENGGVREHALRTPVARDAYHSWEKYRSGRSLYSDTYSLDGRFHTRETMDL